MTDKKLLERVAKAAGIKALRDPHGAWRDCTNYVPLMCIFSAPLWNPLTDDGDALRLAVKLNLWKSVRDGHQHVDSGNDLYAATRRAIVRAAAAIGQAVAA